MSKQPYPSDQDILCVRKKVWMTWAVLIDQELIKLVVESEGGQRWNPLLWMQNDAGDG